MAEKETNSTKKSTTAKPAEKTTAKPAEKPAPKATATAKPAEKPAPKATVTAKPAEKPAPKATASAKPAEKPAPKATASAKPAEKPAPKATAKPVEKPAPAEPKAVAAEKPAKTSGGGSAFKAKAAAIVRTDNFKIISIIALACMFVLFLSLGLVLGLRNCAGDSEIPTFLNAYATTTKVGYSAQVEGTIKRYKPVDGVQDERDAFPLGINVDGNKRYPTYGSTLREVIGADDLKSAARGQLVTESAYLCAWGTRGANRGGEQTADKYTKIDKDGWLYQYKNDEWIHSLKWGTTEQVESNYRRLYKHTASVGLYLGDVSDSEPGLVKKILLRPRGYSSYSVTGLYAPAGEVIKIELSGKDMDATGGISVHIGQALYNGQANNIWVSKNQMQRIPHILTTLAINKTTATYDEATDTWTGYIGSFLGGPIYIRNSSAIFTAKISGAVAYRHFILGYTTPEEYASLSKSTAPMFDLEVWDRGVLHSGPVRYAKNFSYDDLYKAAVLWEKVSSVTASSSNQGIVFLYDPFVAAGAAVAFPGRSSVNCPLGWMAQSLNYNSIVTSGSWGNFHEYHHNFQNYGFGYTGEVTNNGLTLVSYSLFTKISSARRISGYGGSGLSGWNQYTSATWALQRVNNNQISSTNGLAVYATMMHNLGQDAFTKSRGASGAAYFNKWAANTHQDFTYFAEQVQSYSTVAPANLAKTDYPMFVPVSSVYQTGRSYNYDGEKRYIQTMQPYVIPSGQPFTVDLNKYTVNDAGQYESGSVVIGNGFKFSVKSVDASKANGTFEKTGDGIYKFTPNSETLSGKIYVTLEITTESGENTYKGHALEDVDLVLEFQQSHEANKNTLERTVYTFAESKYKSATEAYEAGYAGNSGEETVNNKNYSQDSNTDIWLSPERDKDDPTFGQYVFTPNSVIELKGKLYFPEAGKYRIYMRGRLDCALYISRDGGKTYTEAVHIDRDSGLGTKAQFFPNDSRTYVDVDVEAEDWIYFKEVLIVEPMPNSANMVSYVGLGIGQWTVPMYTTEVRYYTNIGGKEIQVFEDADFDGRYYYEANKVKHFVESDGTRYYYNTDGVMVSETRASAVETRTIYKDSSGKEVSADKASNVTPVEPTSVTYATAYRQSYEFQKQFESEYFYTRNYTYDYKDNVWQNQTQTLVKEQCKYMSPPTNWGWGSFPIDNLVDGNRNTFIHTRAAVTESSPLELVVDMGEVKTVNRMIIYSQYRPNGDWKVAKSFTLKGSIDGVEFFDVGEFVDVPRNGSTVTVNFDKAQFRYYKLTVTKSYNNHVIIGEIEMWKVYELTGGKQLTPDNAMFTYTGTWKTDSASSSYGHVYVGQSGSEMKFEFEGAYLAVFSSDKFEKNYEVYIDGNKLDTVEHITQAGGYSISYLSPELSQGKHSVVIKCTGEANIDSVVFFNTAAT